MSTDLMFRVVVRQNMVAAVLRLPRSEAGPSEPSDDPLAVSTLLARNNLTNGCLDGDYDFSDFERARQFAALCIGYMKNLCEKSLDAINEAGRDGATEWRNHFVPKAGDWQS